MANSVYNHLISFETGKSNNESGIQMKHFIKFVTEHQRNAFRACPWTPSHFRATDREAIIDLSWLGHIDDSSGALPRLVSNNSAYDSPHLFVSIPNITLI